jgi:hypothetical protein
VTYLEFETSLGRMDVRLSPIRTTTSEAFYRRNVKKKFEKVALEEPRNVIAPNYAIGLFRSGLAGWILHQVRYDGGKLR